jgi:MoxR-like ATPase
LEPEIRRVSDAMFEAARATVRRIGDNIRGVMRGQDGAIRKLLAALAGGGHVLIEDFPGTGKTTLAKALALSVRARFRRLQFTPDLLPSDILGVSIYDPRDHAFRFHEGPVFTDILLADEINRASPRTQSALLEAMAEGQVSIDGERRPLSTAFFVVATQNPIEFRGTYPLPEAQMDRFAMQFRLGYPSPQEEASILSDHVLSAPIDSMEPCASLAEIEALRAAVRLVRVGEAVRRYAIDLVGATRAAEGVQLGGSVRASLTLVRMGQAMALFDGLDFLPPEPLQELAVPVIAHRLVLDPQAKFAGLMATAVVEEIVRRTPVPA